MRLHRCCFRSAIFVSQSYRESFMFKMVYLVFNLTAFCCCSPDRYLFFLCGTGVTICYLPRGLSDVSPNLITYELRIIPRHLPD